MTLHLVRVETCVAIRALLSSVPRTGASAQQRADYYLRKAEVLDLLAATYPSLATPARELADQARREAARLAPPATDERG
jgi:hypothetical protein